MSTHSAGSSLIGHVSPGKWSPPCNWRLEIYEWERRFDESVNRPRRCYRHYTTFAYFQTRNFQSTTKPLEHRNKPNQYRKIRVSEMEYLVVWISKYVYTLQWTECVQNGSKLYATSYFLDSYHAISAVALLLFWCCSLRRCWCFCCGRWCWCGCNRVRNQGASRLVNTWAAIIVPDFICRYKLPDIYREFQGRFSVNIPSLHCT